MSFQSAVRPGPQARTLACVAAILGAVGSIGAGAAPTASLAADGPTTIRNYTDPGQAMGNRSKSHWIQPWRSYSDTPPATTLLNAVGINFNVRSEYAEQTARLLESSGFTRARIEMGWNTISYDDPDQMNANNRAALVTDLSAMKDHGIRPLIVLNANSGGPCPVKLDTITVTKLAAEGDTTLHIDPADVGKIVPGKTGIRSGGTAANYLFTKVEPDGTATLSAGLGELWASKPSQPVIKSIGAGPLDVETLLYSPFPPEALADGSPNPAFEPTMRGWLDYIGVITREAEATLGSEEFDVEIWNELSFGSRFLNINGYYGTPLYDGSTWNPTAILSRSVAYLRDPDRTPEIGIGNGFSNESPGWGPEESPAGLTAQDKHPYPPWRPFPSAERTDGSRPLNGLGEDSGTRIGDQWAPQFTPTYDAFFPEYMLSGIQNQTLVRDLSPTATWYAGSMHGRNVNTPGGDPLEHWITEINLNPTGGPAARQLSAADIRHIETKAVLRTLVAYVNKGMTAIDFYAANDGSFSLVDGDFFNALKKSHTTYPGDAAGGETMAALRRLTGAFSGGGTTKSRAITLNALTDYAENVQFQGNGTREFPPLYNRDVFAFLPFQLSDSRFVVPVYVMTRNMEKTYGSGTDPTRFDMPPEKYGMTIGGVDGEKAEVAAFDPIADEKVAVEVVSRSSDDLVVEMPVTDSPRLLTIEEDGDGPPVDPPVNDEDSPVEVPGGDPEQLPEQPQEGDLPTPPVEEPPHGDTGLVSPSGLSATPSVALRGGRTLLRKRRLGVIARCQARCTVRVKGILIIRGHRYPMRTTPNRAIASDAASTPMIVELGISPELARLGRRALEEGSKVKVAVQVRAQGETGKALTASEQLVIHP